MLLLCIRNLSLQPGRGVSKYATMACAAKQTFSVGTSGAQLVHVTDTLISAGASAAQGFLSQLT